MINKYKTMTAREGETLWVVLLRSRSIIPVPRWAAGMATTSAQDGEQEGLRREDAARGPEE